MSALKPLELLYIHYIFIIFITASSVIVSLLNCVLNCKMQEMFLPQMWETEKALEESSLLLQFEVWGGMPQICSGSHRKTDLVKDTPEWFGGP